MASSESSTAERSIDGEMRALHVSDSDPDAHVQLAAEMVSRCTLLLAELEEFQEFLEGEKKVDMVDLRGFKNDIEAELRRIKGVRLP